MKKILNGTLGMFGLRLVRSSFVEELLANRVKAENFDFLQIVSNEYVSSLIAALPNSKAQLRQDLFVLSEVGFKNNGFFVEFGATNGIDLSNTHLLEKEFHWKGILAEPAKVWHFDLKKNRSVKIETDCVWKQTGEKLMFNEVRDSKYNGELSTINSFSASDLHGKARKANNNVYSVDSISLTDMLEKHGAPSKIDYLSIDTEGSEFEILNAFDFERYDIKIITCEHNYTPMRDKIFELLSSHGYIRKYEEFSQFDDWYVRQ